MTHPSTRPATPDEISPAEIAALLGRGALPVAPLAMPVQPLEGTSRALLPRLVAHLALRAGN